MTLTAASGYHPHWRVHLVVRVHPWEARDACAQSCLHPARASLSLRDACAWAVARVWIDCLCTGHLHSSTLGHLNAGVVDQSAIGMPVHLQMGHACDTRAWKRLGRVHLLCKRCVRL